MPLISKILYIKKLLIALAFLCSIILRAEDVVLLNHKLKYWADNSHNVPDFRVTDGKGIKCIVATGIVDKKFPLITFSYRLMNIKGNFPMSLKIFTTLINDVTSFAINELIKYAAVSGTEFIESNNLDDASIVLGTFKSLQMLEKDDYWNDSFMLRTKNGKLYIAGSNARSILFGVYEYLKIHGFKFLYPGDEGEIIPVKVGFGIDKFDLFEKADRNYRGMAAFPEYNNWEEAEKLIDWMAKNKLNLYFQEGFGIERPGDEYSIVDGVHPLQHVEHPHAEKSWEQRCEIAQRNQDVIKEAQKRGLIIERGGHGWNYGVPEHYAAVKGISLVEARETLKAKGNINEQADVAVSTWFQLCLAKPEVRDIYAAHIAEYIETHQDKMDITAVWVGDGYDNSCQCNECLKQPVSDYYLEIIRKVAERIVKTAPKIKLECIIYFETLEAPTRNYLAGLNNVIINFAAWRQCYIHRIDDPKCKFPDWEPDYRHNKSHDKKRDLRILNYDQFKAYQKWREIIGNDFECYVFNYITLLKSPDRHFMSYNAKNLVRDLKDFDKLNFAGMVPCQVNCNWDKPANLQLFTMARFLWSKDDNNADLIREELFENLFGKYSKQIIQYCDEIYNILLKCDYHHSLSHQKVDLLKEIEASLLLYKKKFEVIHADTPIIRKRLKYFSHSLDSLVYFLNKKI